jgi:hypothetical protein
LARLAATKRSRSQEKSIGCGESLRFHAIRHAGFTVSESNGQAVADVYGEDGASRRTSAKLHTRDAARRIAAKIAKLPDLLQRPPGAAPGTRSY